MELTPLNQAIEVCHQLAKGTRSEEDWRKVGFKAEYTLMKLSKISGEPCENAHMTVKVSTDYTSGVIRSFGYAATGAFPA